MAKIYTEGTPRFVLTKRRVISGVVVFLIIGLGIVIFAYHPWKIATSNDKKTLPIASSQPTIADQAYMKANSGQITEAYALIDKSIESAKSQDEKQQLLLDKTILAYNRGDYQRSLDFGLTAEKTKSSLSLSQILARAAGKLGKTELAIHYWNKSISQLDVDQNPSYMDDKASAEKAIKQLQNVIWQ